MHVMEIFNEILHKILIAIELFSGLTISLHCHTSRFIASSFLTESGSI
jgi:hypothetical protein